MGESSEAHVVNRRNEHACGDPTRLLRIVSRRKLTILFESLAMSEQHNDPWRIS